MQKLKMGLMASALVVACGCTQGTPGGPGVQTRTETQTHTVAKPDISGSGDMKPATTESRETKTVVKDSRETFSLSMPILSTTVKQGEMKSITIGISRGNNFDEDVKLSFSDVPSGVTLEPMNPTIAKSDKELKLNVSAGADAALGDFTVKVIGHPIQGGADATNQFKVNVSAK